MKYKFETDDKIEAKRLAKSLDMALFVYNLKCLMQEKNEIKCNEVYELLDYHGINIDDILE